MKFIYDLLKRFLSSDLGKGSLILFILINIFNFLNYFFHFTMARLLTPADYGVLGVLMSIVYIYSIPAEAIQGIFSKYTTRVSGENKKTKYLIKKGLEKVFVYGLGAFIIASFIGFFLSYLLNINFWLIFLINFMIFGILITSVFRGILQGKKRFSYLGWNMVIESGIRLIIAIPLVLIGLSVFGSVVGVIVGTIFGILFAALNLKIILHSKEEKTKLDGIKSYSTSFIGAMVAIVLMYSLDIILARRFFPEDIVGKYTVLSMLSKMIFFGTLPIAKALFPVSSEKFVNKENTKPLFYKSLLVTLSLCVIAVLCFLFFPKLVIGLLFGRKYIEVAAYLVYIGLAIAFLSLANLVVFYGQLY